VSVKDGTLLFRCHAGCAQADVLAALRALGLQPEREPEHRNGTGRAVVATYDYRSTSGELLHQTVRYAPKEFRQRRPDGHGGWIWNLKGIQPVLYRPNAATFKQDSWVNHQRILSNCNCTLT
jgi:hypothetical protein